MTLRNTTDRYGSVSIGLHWMTLTILIGVYACINLTDLYPKGSEPRETLKAWHFMLGPTVLVFVALRLFESPRGRKPCGRWKEVHETIGTIGYLLIGAHALAALFHHCITRDNTLVGMLPKRR